MARSNPGYPVDPNRAELAEAIEESRNLRVMAPPPPMPPPPPSRRPPAQFVAAPPLNPPAQFAAAPLNPPPQTEAPNVDWNAPTVDASELEIEENPFQKKRRWSAWLTHRISHRPAWLKKPSREMTLRGGIAVLALAVGWGIGAKPWKRSRTNAPAHAVAAHSAPKKPALAVRGAQASHFAKPAPYRTASINHAAPPKSGVIANTNKPAPKASTKPAAHAGSAKPATHPVSTKPATHPVSTKPATHPVSAKPAAHPVSTKPAPPR